MSEAAVAPGRIAIIGMAGRFPGAANLASFWANLTGGVESIRQFAEAELDDWFDQATRKAPNFVKARPVLDGVDLFDAPFFDMTGREAALTDPQHRVFLECAWEAFEDAGYDPAICGAATGVFAGCSMNTYFLNNICADRAAIEAFTSGFQVGNYSELLGAGREFLATRVSYKLDLRGPSMTVQTACSTSLVAIAQACQSLLLYQTDMALAGGVSISFPQARGYLYQEGGIVSADGHCRPFDAQASGTVFGSGAGVVLLKRLEDALADRDHIYAVILGTGISNDGAGKAGFTAPSVAGQVASIEQALAQAGVPASSIGYVECHGTATPLGDPIEIAALTQAFAAAANDRPSPIGSCAIGSVKGNIGHLDAASGVAGLIKTALMLKHAALVPSLHYAEPNPHIDFARSPFFVSTETRPWPAADAPRRACVASLGVGGTNAHVVMEAPPAHSLTRASGRAVLLVCSARSALALNAMEQRLATHLETSADRLEDIEATLQYGRHAFAFRSAVVATDGVQGAARLRAQGAGSATREPVPSGGLNPPIAFMFPGQGSQYPRMGADLYRRYSVFRAEIDCCASILMPHGIDLVELLYGGEPGSAADRLRRTANAQPAIFSVSYALARLLQSWGIHPAALIGHSVGECVSACLAGVFTLDDALGFVAARGAMMDRLPAGAMTSVRLSETAITPWLRPGISLAAVNAPSLCVLAGPVEAIAALEAALAAQNVLYRRLQTSHAFHSSMMDPIVAPLAAHVHAADGVPNIPLVSSVTGEWMTQGVAAPDYWASHARAPVRFAAALRTLCASGAPLLLEVGPGNTLAMLAALSLRAAGERATIVSCLPDAARGTPDDSCLLEAVGRLWTAGVTPNWAAVADGVRNRVCLPSYPFERSRHWIPPPAAQRGTVAPQNVARPIPSPPHETIMPRSADRAPAFAVPSHPHPAPAAPAGLDSGAGLRRVVIDILQDVSGEALGEIPPAATFLELGFDSLLLSQVAQQLQKRLRVKIAFRQLLGEFATLPALVGYLESQQPATAVPAALPPSLERSGANASDPGLADTGPLATLMRAQIEAMTQLMQQQLQILRQAGADQTTSVTPVPAIVPPATAAAPAPHAAPMPAQTAAAPAAPSRFEINRAAAGAVSGLTPHQTAHIAALVARLDRRCAGSKQAAATGRPVLADPRAAAGFRLEWKELVYPIVSTRSEGARFWDVDGNDYIDFVNGYGPTAFGHNPDFVRDALREQIDRGFATGPQAELAAEVAALFTEMTGTERMTFCNTGSEAVMAAMRVARTVTGRDRIVMFNGDYHGQFDEVLVRAARRADGTPRAVPAAAGIPDSAAANMIVLDFGAPDALRWIEQNAEQVAAVLVEPVQSRHPDHQPFAFLHALRALTEATGIAFVMDEIVTGFRVHPGGMQAVTGIRADLATYGKVVGGGLPIGILAGKARFMDALDGGPWRYGDESVPEVGVTFFAGTFVRHPLAVAAVRAVLRHLKTHGPALQAGIARRAQHLAEGLDALFRRYRLAATVERYASFLYFSLHAEGSTASLLYYHLRARGIYLQENFPIFLTSAHGEAEVAATLAAFEDSLQAMAQDGMLGTLPAAEPGPLVPTEAQTEIWLAAQMGDDASCAFNESVTLRLAGPLDPAVLYDALAHVILRHDALRLRFSATGETMTVAAGPGFTHVIEPADQTGSGADAEACLAAFIAADALTPFDLVEGPLLRTRLFRLGPDRHALVLTAHHIVCDGWSINVLVGELASCLAAVPHGQAPVRDPVLPFTAYARAEAARDPASVQTTLDYWMDQYADPLAPFDLPTDRPRPEQRSHLGDTRCRRIEIPLYRAVKEAGARQGGTLFVTLLAAFECLVGRLAGVEDVAIAVPTAGQTRVDDRALVGHCVDFLPIRGRWQADTSFAEHIGSVAAQVLGAHEHQDCTLGTIVRRLAPRRRAGHLPLTDLQFNLERLASDIEAEGLTIEVEPNAKARVNYDLFWNVIESPAGLRIDCDFNTQLYDAATIDRWLACYETLLGAIVADAGQPVSQIGWVPEWDLALERACNATTRDRDPGGSVIARFERQAAMTPDAVALRFAGQTTSYRALDAAALRVCRTLLARGVRTGQRIGLLCDRSPQMLAALLGIWKAGCAYVPLDPAHPTGRLDTIISSADIAALLTDGMRRDLTLPADLRVIELKASDTIDVLDPTAEPQAPTATAYVIFTSGSTGVPKGVEISQSALLNLLDSIAERPGLSASDTLVAITTISFDIAALELFGPLLVGGTVALAEQADVIDGDRLRRCIEDVRATVVQATPSGWRMLLEAGFCAGPGFTMLCGGEALPRPIAEQLLAGGARLWNMYGPTETTVWSAVSAITPGSDPITIGSPIANTGLWVRDRGLQPVPVGVPGELCISGDGLAIGYLGQAELTGARFVADPTAPDRRIYRSGDLARRLPDGTVQLLGRLDQQVKLRGYRIELAEIEASLLRHAPVSAAAVGLRHDLQGAPQLVGYVVPRADEALSDATLQSCLAADLPGYMIPSVWVRLMSLPVLANGKLDRAALPAPPSREPPVPAAIPVTPLEQMLAAIWAEVLHLPAIGRDDDLFELGADSIHIFQIAARANRQGLRLSARALLDHPTIAGLAAALAATNERHDLAFHEVHADQDAAD